MNTTPSAGASAGASGYFADRLKELRGVAGLSQPELALRSDLSVGGIRQFEQGRREPTFETLVKLAAGLGVSLAAFDPPPAEPESKRARKPKRS
jgi:transcriptional regulator with XRE-family HTH domain